MYPTRAAVNTRTCQVGTRFRGPLPRRPGIACRAPEAARAADARAARRLPGSCWECPELHGTVRSLCGSVRDGPSVQRRWARVETGPGPGRKVGVRPSASLWMAGCLSIPSPGDSPHDDRQRHRSAHLQQPDRGARRRARRCTPGRRGAHAGSRAGGGLLTRAPPPPQYRKTRVSRASRRPVPRVPPFPVPVPVPDTVLVPDTVRLRLRLRLNRHAAPRRPRPGRLPGPPARAPVSSPAFRPRSGRRSTRPSSREPAEARTGTVPRTRRHGRGLSTSGAGTARGSATGRGRDGTRGSRTRRPGPPAGARLRVAPRVSARCARLAAVRWPASAAPAGRRPHLTQSAVARCLRTGLGTAVPSAPDTSAAATLRSLTLECWDTRTRTCQAVSASHGARAITMPLAWSMTGRLASASRSWPTSVSSASIRAVSSSRSRADSGASPGTAGPSGAVASAAAGSGPVLRGGGRGRSRGLARRYGSGPRTSCERSRTRRPGCGTHQALPASDGPSTRKRCHSRPAFRTPPSVDPPARYQQPCANRASQVKNGTGGCVPNPPVPPRGELTPTYRCT